ncbi:hypothetical protein [Polynucleobacter sphagniphilus]|uniref:hypothetical protein n=1 Tax=Polynucleobacter sphagniphilus TaxID=1743169 RepID=UPI00247725B8|nr:hypothetical protein [Polynucleobacter sphagniphilus]MDH6525679.1 hypothetical protein [Polynucleobacter sphagniphilus]
MTTSCKKTQSFSKLDYFIYSASLTLCFLLFKQSDLTVTNNASFAFLHGHFWDFYDYAQAYFDNYYLPVFYWFFAIWNIPLALFGLTPEVTLQTWAHSTPIQTIWSKLLLALFFFGCVKVIGKIADQICDGLGPSGLKYEGLAPRNLLATSPFAIFVVFIFSQYDIFGVFFTLLGLHSYFSRRWKWFAFWFSVAISFKYFAALLFLPLVLNIEKRFLPLLIYGLVGIAVSALQFLLYWHSDAFLGQIFYLVRAKTTDNGISIRLLLAAIAYGAMCIYFFLAKINILTQSKEWQRQSVFACLFAYVLMFSAVHWNPQWLVLVTPFVCLCYLYINSQKALVLLEILGFVGLTFFCINNWAGNVDISMIYGGIFGDFLPANHLLAGDLIGRHSMAISRVCIYLFLYSPFLVYGLERWPLARMYCAKFSKDSNLSKYFRLQTLFNARFLVGPYIWMILTMICFSLA